MTDYPPQGPWNVDSRMYPVDNPGTKSFVVTWLLALFLGSFGADRFYLGKTGTAVAKLCTCGGCGIWALVDLIVILAGHMRDANGYRLAGVDDRDKRAVAWIVSAIVVVAGGSSGPHVTWNDTTTDMNRPVITVTATP